MKPWLLKRLLVLKMNPSSLYVDNRKKCFEGILESGPALPIAGQDHERVASLEGISCEERMLSSCLVYQRCQGDCFSVILLTVVKLS